jgi:hypothetical protein
MVASVDFDIHVSRLIRVLKFQIVHANKIGVTVSQPCSQAQNVTFRHFAVEHVLSSYPR